MIPEHGTMIGGYLLQNINDGGVSDWSPFTNALPSTRNAQTPNDWDVRLVNIKLSARWQAAHLKRTFGTCTKVESRHLIDGSPAYAGSTFTPSTRASSSAPSSEKAFCSDVEDTGEDDTDPEAAQVKSLRTELDAALTSLSQVSPNTPTSTPLQVLHARAILTSANICGRRCSLTRSPPCTPKPSVPVPNATPSAKHTPRL